MFNEKNLRRMFNNSLRVVSSLIEGSNVSYKLKKFISIKIILINCFVNFFIIGSLSFKIFKFEKLFIFSLDNEFIFNIILFV